MQKLLCNESCTRTGAACNGGQRQRPYAGFMTFTHADYVVVIVESLERALPFYTELLGLPLKHRSGPFAQLDTGATQLALFERAAMEQTVGLKLTASPLNAPGFELGFKVDDIEAVFDALVTGGALALTPPTDRPWGQRTAYLRDPDGHLIELVQAIK
jgi:lactoylglutathione lyase